MKKRRNNNNTEQNKNKQNAEGDESEKEAGNREVGEFYPQNLYSVLAQNWTEEKKNPHFCVNFGFTNAHGFQTKSLERMRKRRDAFEADALRARIQALGSFHLTSNNFDQKLDCFEVYPGMI